MSAEAQFRSLIDRILRRREDQDAIGEDVKEIYAEAKGLGYDKTAMGALVAELRKRAKNGAKADEAEAILDLYRQAYHNAASHTHTHTHTHTHAPAHTREEHDAETGEIIEPDATPAGAVVAESSGATAGETAIHSEAAGTRPNPSMSRSSEGAIRSEGGAPEALTPQRGKQQCETPGVTVVGFERETVTEYLEESREDADAPHVTSVASQPAPPPAQAATAASFLAQRPAVKLRPHCRRPDNCGGYGSTHCGSCLRAAREVEAARCCSASNAL